MSFYEFTLIFPLFFSFYFISYFCRKQLGLLVRNSSFVLSRDQLKQRYVYSNYSRLTFNIDVHSEYKNPRSEN